MPQARDIMTTSLTTCSPLDSVAQAAQLMRNHNIGDVLVTDDGRLVGIVTDRDIALRVASKALDPEQVPVRKVMSSRVRTGEPSWDLDHVVKAMGKHQIRRLPIVENSMLVGMVSLSDMALHHDHKSHVAKSLKEISESHGAHRIRAMERKLLRVTVGLGLLTAAAVALSLLPKYGVKLWDQVQASRIGDRWSNGRPGRAGPTIGGSGS